MPASMDSTYRPQQECPVFATLRADGGLAPATQHVHLPTVTLRNQAGADTTALLMGAGSSADPATTSTANKNFLQFYTETTTTTAGSDTRAAYIRLYINGASTGGGEALRAFTTVEQAIGTAHGAHISLNWGTSGGITGQAIAMRGTLHAKNATSGAGTFAAVQAEVYSDGASTDVSAATAYSFIRVVNAGNATGIANVDDNAFFIDFSGMTAGANNMISAAGNEPTWNAKTHQIRCRLPDGSTCYLVAVIP